MNVKPLGPGPGAYVLPPTVGFDHHDSRKNRLPQYSFGARVDLRNKNPGPGAGAYQVDKVTRYGKSVGLEFSLAPRTNIIVPKNAGPGPGAHEHHNKPFFTGTNAPSFSIGHRTEYQFKRWGPGPNNYKYELGPTKPGAPSFSIGMRTKSFNKMASPGPAAYGAPKLPGSLEYSLGRRTPLMQKSVGPGPNYYDLMYYRPGKTGHSYSFGVRHNPFAPPMIVKCDNL